MAFIELIFWLSSFLVVYTFALYGPLLGKLARMPRFQVEFDTYSSEDSLPSVTLIISAFNEEEVIKEKLENALETDYPADKFSVVVISDASDDQTDEIVKNMAQSHSQIRLIRQEERKGKTSGINLAFDSIESELVVFSDANAMYKEDAVFELVKKFKDSRVGYVVGAALYNQDSENYANESESEYWDEELKLKDLESQVYSVVGGDGAIYGIRKDLYQPLQTDDINDFANPLHIVAQGYRGAFNGRAICFEDSADDFSKEYKRKRRIVNRSFRAFSRYLNRFNLSEHKMFLFLLVSHKVLRWFSGFLIVLSLLTGLVLSSSGAGWLYTLSVFLIILSMCLALLGKRASQKGDCPKLLYLLYYFYLVNIGAMLGIADNFRGRRHVTWDHVRKSDQG